MSVTVPTWLDETAKEYWRKVYPEIRGSINNKNRESFALLCAVYSDYRKALAEGDTRQKKLYLDYFLKFAKEFGLTPKSDKAPSSNKVEEESFEFEVR